MFNPLLSLISLFFDRLNWSTDKVLLNVLLRMRVDKDHLKRGVLSHVTGAHHTKDKRTIIAFSPPYAHFSGLLDASTG